MTISVRIHDMKPDYYEYKNAWRKRFEKRRQKRLMLKQQAHEIAIEAALAIAKHFYVQKVYLFGSVLREDDYFYERSDIDLAVEGLAPVKYFPMLVMLDRKIESPFEINVVSLETCDEILKQKILSEGELLYGQ